MVIFCSVYYSFMKKFTIYKLILLILCLINHDLQLPIGMMMRLRNEKHLRHSRQFFRFAGGSSSTTFPKSYQSGNSTVSDGIPTRGGIVRSLIDGTIFMTWIVLGAIFMLIIGMVAPEYSPKNTCKEHQVFR
jgi:hypothetical protein